MDQTVRYRLLLTKTFFENASHNLDRNTPESLAVAVVNAHDALDNLFGALATHLSVHLKERNDATMLGTYDTIGSTGHALGSRAKLAQLNAVRIDVKHHGLHPNPAVARALIAELRTFADEVSSTHFGKTLAEIRLVGAISSDDVREEMTEIEKLITAGDYRNALERMAFVIFKVYEREKFNAHRFVRMIARIARRQPATGGEFEFPDLDRAELRFDMLGLGIDPQEYDRFHSIVPQIGLGASSDTAYIIKKSRYVWHEENWTRPISEMAFDFLTRLIVAKQERTVADLIVRRYPNDKVTFLRRSPVYDASEKKLVKEFEAGDELVTLLSLPFVEGQWQNPGEETINVSILLDGSYTVVTIKKDDIVVTPDVPPPERDEASDKTEWHAPD